MSNNEKKYIVLIFILFLALYNASDKSVQAQVMQQATQQQAQVVQVKTNIDYKALNNNQDWQVLRKIWKQCNHFDEEYGNKSLNEQREQFSKINNNVYKNIDSLKRSQLLTEDEANYINYIINTRLTYLERRYTLLMCRRMLPPVRMEKNLEERFDTLERLYKDGKLNSDAYKIAKQKLKEDLTELNRLYGRPEIKQNNLNLLLYLNQ